MVKKQKKLNKPVESIDEEKVASKNDISGKLDDIIKWSITDFDKISEEEKIRLYGDKEFLDQFWNYFKEKNPNLIDKIDKDDLKEYLQKIEKSWFTIGKIRNDEKYVGKFSKEFKSEWTEKQTMENSLVNLKSFCEDKKNDLFTQVPSAEVQPLTVNR